MSRQVTIQSGYSNVVLPDRGSYDAGDVVVLTDEEFAGLAPGIVGSVVSDDGQVADETDAVTSQGATVADIADPASATAEAVANKVNEALGQLRGETRALADA